jgi:flavodoxin I
MKVLVVYDSVFGNTEKIAMAIGSALGSQGEVETLRVGNVKAEQLAGLDLLIVGSPTRGFRPTEGIQTFLKSISPGSLKGLKVAAFDTRMTLQDINSPVLNLVVRIIGFRYAASPIADALKKKGGDLVTPPDGFFVKKAEGPLKEGELERAVEWAKGIKASLS